MFMSLAASHCEVIKKNGWCIYRVNFMGKVNLTGCLEDQDWMTSSITQQLFLSLCQCFAKFLLESRTREKREVSSGKIFMLHSRFAGMSLIEIRNNRGPKIEPWGTPASTFCHSDAWPFKTTLWSLLDKKLFNRHNIKSEIS